MEEVNEFIRENMKLLCALKTPDIIRRLYIIMNNLCAKREW